MGLFGIKILKNKELSSKANEFENYLIKEEIFRSLNSVSLKATYGYDSQNRMKNNYISRINKNSTKVFSLSIVVEYLNWAGKEIDPKTWIYNHSSYIDRINRYHRGMAYYNALKS